MAKHTKPKRKIRSRKKNKTKQKAKLKLSAKKVTTQQSYTEEKSFVELHEYEITDEPIDIWDIPEEIEEEAEDIFHKTHTEPTIVIPRLKKLIEKYPNVPQLYNYLSVAFSSLGEHEETEKIVAKNYEKNPEYLFARLNYAEICIQKKKFDLVPEILESKFDIKALYPHRRKFHITEVVGFWGVSGLYFAGIGKNDTAKIFGSSTFHVDLTILPNGAAIR